MNFKDLKDLVEKKKAARLSQARKQRKPAAAPTKAAPKPAAKPAPKPAEKPSPKPVEKPSTKPETKAEEVAEEAKVEAKVEEAVETKVAEVAEVAVPEENIPTDESAEAPAKTIKKSRKKKRASEVEDGAAE